MERLVLVARLKPGAEERAHELLAAGPPFDPADEGIARHGVYVSPAEVVFVFEGPGVERFVARFVNDPVRSVALSPWQPLVDGPPRIAHEAYFWSPESSPSARA